jgi:hypothetical protein
MEELWTECIELLGLCLLESQLLKRFNLINNLNQIFKTADQRISLTRRVPKSFPPGPQGAHAGIGVEMRRLECWSKRGLWAGAVRRHKAALVCGNDGLDTIA